MSDDKAVLVRICWVPLLNHLSVSHIYDLFIHSRSSSPLSGLSE